ncbi:MAG: holo-ACP synthase [Planctomycetes bacterium]|nr:holo-ACP synthase [Planctomycetota bacterium]
MEILGIGTDIVECLRIRRMIEEHGEQFLHRVFTEKEIRTCQSRKHATEHFAARWAAKEAVLRSLGTSGGNGRNWTDVETDNDETGTTKITIQGGLRELMESRGIHDVLVTFAYCRAYATATAIARGKST